MPYSASRSSESWWLTPLANARWKLSGVCDHVLASRPGRDSTGHALRSCASGRPRMPLKWLGEMAMHARAKPRPWSRSAIRPPKEWPMTTGGEGSSEMTFE